MIRPALIVLPLALAACSKEEQLSVTGAYVRLSPVPTNPSAAYFVLHGGPQDLSLINVSTDVAIRSEMHESMGRGGMMSMKPITSVPVPAGSTVEFKPGGKHVMLWKLNPGVKPPRRVTLNLAFSNGERIQVPAPLVTADEGEPAK